MRKEFVERFCSGSNNQRNERIDAFQSVTNLKFFPLALLFEDRKDENSPNHQPDNAQIIYSKKNSK